MNRQYIERGHLVTVSSRQITERRAQILDLGDGKFAYEVFSDGVRSPASPRNWPPENTEVPPNWPALDRLKEYLEIVQFGDKPLDWIREGNLIVSVPIICDSGGNRFTTEELSLIRESQRKKKRST